MFLISGRYIQIELKLGIYIHMIWFYSGNKERKIIILSCDS